jgi:hypothetical protein
MAIKRTVRGVSAWVVTWEKFGRHVKKPCEIAAILNPRIGHQRVKELVELLYVNQVFTLSEKIGYSMNKRFNPYPAEYGSTKGIRWTGIITCGHNPFLEAKLVKNLIVSKKGNREHISWTDIEPKVSYVEKNELN